MCDICHECLILDLLISRVVGVGDAVTEEEQSTWVSVPLTNRLSGWMELQ